MGSSSSKEKASNANVQNKDPTPVAANNNENSNQTLVPKGFETLTSRAEEGQIISETIKQEEIKVKGNLDALISELNQMEQENPDPRTEEIAKQIEALKHYIKLQMETLGKIKGRRYQVICRNGLNSLIAAERVAEDFEKESGRDYCCGGGHGHTDRNSSFIYSRNQLNLNIDKDININVPG